MTTASALLSIPDSSLNDATDKYPLLTTISLDFYIYVLFDLVALWFTYSSTHGPRCYVPLKFCHILSLESLKTNFNLKKLTCPTSLQSESRCSIPSLGTLLQSRISNNKIFFTRFFAQFFPSFRCKLLY